MTDIEIAKQVNLENILDIAKKTNIDENDVELYGKYKAKILNFEKQENIKEISTLVSMACGKEMQIKYISEAQSQAVVHRPVDDIQKLANQSDIPFNVIE